MSRLFEYLRDVRASSSTDELSFYTPPADLHLLELVNWTADALNRADRPSFFERFSEEEAVQYFYEPFLEALDPLLHPGT